MRVYEASLDYQLLETLISFSEDWEGENSCHGYRKNDRSDIDGNRIFLAAEGEEILGYLFGKTEKSERDTSIMPKETVYFEIEELYVIPQRRSQGVGRELFQFAEDTLRAEGMPYLMLSTATKDYKRILHFYIEEMGMEFWSARLFKRIEENQQ